MSSLMDFLLNQPSVSDRLMGLLPLIQAAQAPGTTTNGLGATTGPGTTPSGTSVMPNGDTQYPYQTWAFPFNGLDPNDPRLVSRFGITLQQGPMQSLIDIARADDMMRGAHEISLIGQGYRSPEQQAYAAQHNPNAADLGHSYHPEGLAIDAGAWSANNYLNNALYQAGWNQFDRSAEPWHYSFGVSG